MWSMEAPKGRSTSALEERTALLTAPTSPGVRAGAWLCAVPSLSEGGMLCPEGRTLCPEGGTLCPEGGMQGKEAGGRDCAVTKEPLATTNYRPRGRKLGAWWLLVTPPPGPPPPL